MARYLVTGGCGFIGSHLVASLLADGHAVRVLDDLSTGRRNNVPTDIEVRVGSVTDPACVEQALEGVDGCFHLAAIASISAAANDWRYAHDVNLTGFLNVVQAIQTSFNSAIPVVYASSAAVYGDASNPPSKETDRPAPISNYGADKVGCERHATVAATTHDMAILGLRLFNVYGPGQDPSVFSAGVVAKFLRALRSHQPVDVYGDGGQIRDFVHVSDAVRFLTAGMDYAAARASTADIFNVCTGRGTSILELIDLIGDELRVRPNVRLSPAHRDDIRISIGCPSHAAGSLGIVTDVDLNTGIRNTLQPDWSDAPKALEAVQGRHAIGNG